MVTLQRIICRVGGEVVVEAQVFGCRQNTHQRGCTTVCEGGCCSTGILWREWIWKACLREFISWRVRWVILCVREDQRKTEWCKLRVAKHVCLNMLDVFAPLLLKDECKCFHLKWQNMDSFICNSSEHVRAHFMNYMCSWQWVLYYNGKHFIVTDNRRSCDWVLFATVWWPDISPHI